MRTKKLLIPCEKNLEIAIPKFCEYFNNNSFKEILPELNHYHNNVKKHYAAFQATKAARVKVMGHLNKDK